MPNREVHIQLDLKIPMRDGVQLYGAMYRHESECSPGPSQLGGGLPQVAASGQATASAWKYRAAIFPGSTGT